MGTEGLPSSREGLLRLLYEEDRVVIEDRIVVAAAWDVVKRAALLDLWTMLSRLERPLFPLRGRDVVGEGSAGSLEAGPQVGELLGEVEAWWIARDFTPDRESCLGEARRLLQRRHL